MRKLVVNITIYYELNPWDEPDGTDIADKLLELATIDIPDIRYEERCWRKDLEKVIRNAAGIQNGIIEKLSVKEV